MLVGEVSISFVDFMNCSEKFKVDEINIDGGDDDFVFNAKENVEETCFANLSGLKYVEKDAQMAGLK